ncbi:MAG: MotA/TolQ/ExbB proton channel family protein [Bacteroidota bacterium]|nr:MotA/TolQ/ExbB proton channel family protein [Bacteroidota bacterium]
MFLFTLLQITTPVSDKLGVTVEPPVSTEDSLPLFELIMKGGIIMIPIFLLSFLAIYLLIERLLLISKSTKGYDSLWAQIKANIKSGDLKTAQSLAAQSDTSIGRMLVKGISKIGQPIKQIESSIEAAGRIEVMKLEKGLSILGIVAAIAPMLGFIGTISGVIKIFYNISLADNISIGLIAGGLYEKMVTSAAGLIVGIIAHTSYHYLNSLIEDSILKLETVGSELIDLLSE